MAQQTGGLAELLDAVRWRWRLMALLAVPFFIGTVVWSRSLPAQYTARSLVSVGPRPNVAGVGADIVRVLAPKYVGYITAPATLQRLAPAAGEPSSKLEKEVNASVAPDTGNVTITVQSASAAHSAAVANILGRDLVSFSQTDALLVAQLVAPAAVPSAPSGPPRKLIDAAGLLVGLLLGVTVASIVEHGRPRARSWRDIAVLTGYPVVGRLPATRAMKSSPARALADPALGAAVRTLRTNLERGQGGPPRGVFVVTSPVIGDGKTTVASLLATAWARLSARVLLIDGDLRRPGLPRLGPPGRPRGDLSKLLRGQGTLEDAIQLGWAEGVYVLPTSPDPDAGDLLARGFADVLRQARERFNVVLVDSPPLLATDDARTLATLGDGLLLVVSVGDMAESISDAVQALQTLNVRVTGVVANRSRERLGAAGYYARVPVGS